jgi:hypothetical protein
MGTAGVNGFPDSARTLLQSGLQPANRDLMLARSL